MCLYMSVCIGYRIDCGRVSGDPRSLRSRKLIDAESHGQGQTTLTAQSESCWSQECRALNRAARDRRVEVRGKTRSRRTDGETDGDSRRLQWGRSLRQGEVSGTIGVLYLLVS